MTVSDILETLAKTLPHPCAVCDGKGEVLWRSWAAREVGSGTGRNQEDVGKADLWAQVADWLCCHWELLDGRNSSQTVTVPSHEIAAMMSREDLRRFHIQVRRLDVGNETVPMVLMTLSVTESSNNGSRGAAWDSGPDRLQDGGPQSPSETLELSGSRGGRPVAAQVAVDTSVLDRLSPREREVALLAARGFSGPNIAALLGVAESTVYSHIKRVHRKLGVHNRAQLAWRILQEK